PKPWISSGPAPTFPTIDAKVIAHSPVSVSFPTWIDVVGGGTWMRSGSSGCPPPALAALGSANIAARATSDARRRALPKISLADDTASPDSMGTRGRTAVKQKGWRLNAAPFEHLPSRRQPVNRGAAFRRGLAALHTLNDLWVVFT